MLLCAFQAEWELAADVYNVQLCLLRVDFLEPRKTIPNMIELLTFCYPGKKIEHRVTEWGEIIVFCVFFLALVDFLKRIPVNFSV